MAKINNYLSLAEKRKRRVRSKIHGTKARPRLTVFRSNQYIYLQLVDDDSQKTLTAVSDVALRKSLKKGEKLTKIESTIKAAEELAKNLKKIKVLAVVLDRGQYKYHGRVKAVAETLRENGIKL
jgi:large subunit ribosomal protein L18